MTSSAVSIFPKRFKNPWKALMGLGWYFSHNFALERVAFNWFHSRQP